MNPATLLIDHFDEYLTFFEDHVAYNFASHIATMQRRYQFANVGEAIEDDEFIRNLHTTLSDWKLRRAGLLPREELELALRRHAHDIQQLEELELGNFNPGEQCQNVWNNILAIPITRKEPRLVSGTKLFHHLLPNLVVPIDRYYTATLLYAGNYDDFKAGAGESETFRVAFNWFSRIAIAIRPRIDEYRQRHAANTSLTKIIDNAIMGFVEMTRQTVWDIIR